MTPQHQHKYKYGQKVNIAASLQSHDRIKSIQKPNNILKLGIGVMGSHLKNEPLLLTLYLI